MAHADDDVGMLIGHSGSGKTPAIDVTKRVLSFIERNRE